MLRKRHLTRKQAWQLVKTDADVYEEQWAMIVERYRDSLGEIVETTKEMAKDIKKAVHDAPPRQAAPAEHQRRTLLLDTVGGKLSQALPSLPLLYVQAFALNDRFQCKCSEWAAGAGKHISTSVKRTERAIQKLWRTYNGNPRSITDLVRSSIVCDTPADILAIVQKIRADSSVGILRIKNRLDPVYDSTLSGGYRNLSLNLIVVDVHTRQACVDMHICELQLELRVIHELKTDGGHRRFVAFRDRRAE